VLNPEKEIRLTPEEVVRQLFLSVLMNEYGYPAERMELEYAFSFGRDKKLLETDKRAVEMAIEQDEEAAMTFINSQLQ
jgi:hypothetical protein